MGIDRDDYEPITGNPRRDTAGTGEEPDTESGVEGGRRSSEASKWGTGGDPSGTDGAPSDADGGPSGTDVAPSVSSGHQQSPGETQVEHHSSTKKSSSGDTPRTPSGRKRRVKVTPKNWNELKQLSERLGVGYSTLYQIAFQQLLQNPQKLFRDLDK